ncbi:MAG TPA: SBBP repeat-containing protein, partial [Nitrospirota bacterium]|nr:SBBP repeat-containing protein [Nitrospirota bacterium]
MTASQAYNAPAILIALSMFTFACNREGTTQLAVGTPTADSTIHRPWTIQHGTAVEDGISDIVVHPSGMIVAAGSTCGGLDGHQNSDPAGATSDLFVIAYDASGARQWTRQLGSEYEDTACDIAVDGSGDIYVTGSTYGGLDGYSNSDPCGPGRTSDLFVMKLSADGTRQWTRQFGSPGRDWAKGITTDRDGRLYVTGFTFDSINGSTNTGGTDLFVAAYDDDGNLLWLRQLGTPFNDNAAGIVAANGVITVVGTTFGGLSGEANQGNADLFLVQFDTEGNRLWTVLYGTEYFDFGVGIAADNNGALYVAGSTQGGLDGHENADPRGPGWTSDLFVIKFSAEGTRQWTRQLGSSFADFGVNVAVDPGGNVYAIGSTQGGLDGYENADPRGPGWTSDLIVIKFSPGGTQQWSRQLGTAFSD